MPRTLTVTPAVREVDGFDGPEGRLRASAQTQAEKR